MLQFFATVSTSWPYSSLRTSSRALVWDPSCWSGIPVVSLGIRMRQQLRSPLHMILHYKRVSVSMWACFRYKAHIEGLMWYCLRDQQLKELKFKVLVPKSLFRACSNCGSQIHVRKLACPCGHVFHGSKLLTTRNASRKSDVSVARALESEEQTAKRRKVRWRACKGNKSRRKRRANCKV